MTGGAAEIQQDRFAGAVVLGDLHIHVVLVPGATQRPFAITNATPI
jgi:hypothetical protein